MELVDRKLMPYIGRDYVDGSLWCHELGPDLFNRLRENLAWWICDALQGDLIGEE